MNPLITILADKAGPQGLLTYEEFVQIALYAPEYGYYRQNKNRVGKNAESDFYTAKTISPLFEKLVIESAINLLPKDSTKDFTFVEMGAEPNQEDWGANSPFKSHSTVRLGEDYPWENQDAGPYVVFANEVLDAQPFDRIRLTEDGWQQLGVKIDPTKTNLLTEVILGKTLAYSNHPTNAPIGYTIDVPTGALAWIKKLIHLDWKGLLILIDYGKTWEQITHECSEGTARTYSQHKQGGNLLNNPGQCDITHDIAWDWIACALQGHGFSHLDLMRQEVFFVKHAHQQLERIFTDPHSTLHDKAALKALIHPGHFGSQFQVMAAKRGI
jgi:SAM-dependent MidA family methyltransferase